MKTTIGAIKSAVKSALRATDAGGCVLTCSGEGAQLEVVAHGPEGFIKIAVETEGNLFAVKGLINGKAVNAILANMADETPCNIRETEAGMTLRFGGATIKLRHPDTDGSEDLFVKAESCAEKRKVLVAKAEDFIAMVRAPSLFKAKKDVRYFLTGVFLCNEAGLLRAVGTSGYFLNYTSSSIPVMEGFTDCIIPALVAHEFGNVFKGDDEVVISQTGKGDSLNIVMQTEKIKWVSRLISGKFPDYKRVLPQPYPDVLTLGRDALVAAINRVHAASQDIYVSIKVRKDGVQVTSPDGEQREFFEMETGLSKEVSLGFTSEILATAIAAVESDEFKFAFSREGNAPISIVPIEMRNYESWYATVMPARF